MPGRDDPPSADPADIAALATLDEPVRRALYEYVVAQAHAVGRDEAADATGVGRALAAFHLDKLVDGGLLATEFRRLSGRTGPGAGRPSKLYTRSTRELDVTIPPRRYELAARLMARSIDPGPGAPLPGALADEATAYGRALGEQARRAAGKRPSRRRLLDAIESVLAAHGFEPHRDGDVVRLANCPFHALIRDHAELVCGMNLRLVRGLIEGAAASWLAASPSPAEGWCCVALGRGRDPDTSGPPER